MNENKPMTVDDEIAYNNYKLTADKILHYFHRLEKILLHLLNVGYGSFYRMQKMYLTVLERYLLK